MKKIFLFIVLFICVAFSAKAQLVSVPIGNTQRSRMEYHLGDYVFRGVAVDDKKGGEFQTDAMDEDEYEALRKYIREHKEEIEKKHNIVILHVENGSSFGIYSVRMKLYDADYYAQKVEEKEMERIRKEEEKNSRMASLERIF